ncbi:sushi, von Willebrand factor type A, EGF and pentraxin domain-containing protein 1-like [Crassostrea virginica]
MQFDGTSPVVIPHPLGVLPAKVDVQVQVMHEGKGYIFPGMGSAQRDDDLAADYGGVGYLYNDVEVKVYVPVATNTAGGLGWVITTASPYIDIPHGLGVYPDFVTVQLTLSSGYVSEAQGTTSTTTDHGPKWVNSCGTIFGTTDTSVTIWAAAGAGGSFPSQPVMIRVFNLDHHIVLVETRDASVAQGRTFYGAGSASEVEAGEPYGGTLYGYNQTHALLWTPAASYGNPIYVDGIWGDGMDPLHIVSVSITVKVIATGAIPILVCLSPPTITNGFYELSNDTASYHCNPGYMPNQIKNIFQCNNSVWENVTFSCEEMRCPEPLNISNALHASSGNHNGSRTLYSCMPGYIANNGSRLIVCNGSHWSETNLTCSEYVTSSCGVPPTVVNAYVEIVNISTVTYHCREGFVANQSSNARHCFSGQWESLSLGCIDTMCPSPVDIPNALMISDGYQNGSITLYSCLAGYIPNDASSGCGLPPKIPNAYYEVENDTATYHCLPEYVGNGSNTLHCNSAVWSHQTFTCLVQTCSAPPVIPNTAMTSSGSNNGSVTVYACLSGFVANGGDPFVSCNGTHWTTTSFSCSAINTCGSPPTLPNSYYVMQNQTTAVYECLPGYIANDSNAAIQCRDTVWDQVGLSCNVLSCPSPPVISNAVMTTSGLTNGSVTVYSCESGFISTSGDAFISCNGTHWSVTSFACSAQSCPSSPDIPHAVQMSSGNFTVYICEAGFVDNDEDPYISCNGTHWTNTLFACSVYLTEGLSAGRSALYSCESGYTAFGENNSITCNGTHWSNINFTCTQGNVQQLACEPPPSVPNAYYEEANNTAMYHCHEGFSANGTDNIINCIDTQWEDPKIHCLNASCISPPDIPNAVKISSGQQNGSLTVYSCLYGYKASNEYNTIVCNGSHWTSTNFSCSQDTSCPAPSDVPNAVRTSSGLGVGSLTIYTCLPGFIPSSELNYITCNGSHWTDTNFTCFSDASCPSPPDIPNTIKSSGGQGSGSLTVYSCLSGYTASNAYSTIFCNGSHWTETNYSCIQGKQNVPFLQNVEYLLLLNMDTIKFCRTLPPIIA